MYVFLLSLMVEVKWERKVEGYLGGKLFTGFYTGGFERAKPVFCDIDKDGDLDLFIGGWDGVLHFYQNENNELKLQTTKVESVDVWWGMKKGYSAPTFGDIDGDGDYDLFSGDYVGRIHFYKNEAGVFKFVDTLPFKRYRHSCPALVDIDGDEDLDLFIGEAEHPGMLLIHKNVGTTTDPQWEETCDSMLMEFRQVSPTFYNIDSDEDYDLFFSEERGYLLFCENVGDAQTPNWRLPPDTVRETNGNPITTYNRGGATFGDYDKDGIVEIMMSGKDGKMRVFKKRENGYEKIYDQFLYLDLGGYSVPTFYDYDKDGDLDLFVGTEGGDCRVLSNEGKNKWKYAIDRFLDTNLVTKMCAPTFCDYDGDGDLDLFCGEKNGGVVCYKNEGNEWSALGTDWTGGDEPIVSGEAKPVFCDIDNDGDYDMFVGDKGGVIYYFRNEGNPNSPRMVRVDDNYLKDTLEGGCAPTFGDLDLDGDLDLLIGIGYDAGTQDSSCGGYIYFYKNVGSKEEAKFELKEDRYLDIDVGRYSTPVLVAIDEDKDLDLFIGEADGGINFWENLTSGVEEGEKIKREMVEVNNCFKEPTIMYKIKEEGKVTLVVYDIIGRKVWRKVKRKTKNEIIEFRIKDLNTGIYFWKIIGKHEWRGKVVVIK